MTAVKDDGTRRRGGRQPAPLSVADVMGAALAITARRGLDALTIKDVAAELGVTSPAVYHYVTGKQALVDRVCEQVTRRTDLTIDATQSWENQIVSIMLAMDRAFASYPGVGARALVHTGPAPGADRIAETMHGILVDAGFPTAVANELVVALYLLFSGWLAGKVPRSVAAPAMNHTLLARMTRRMLTGYVASVPSRSARGQRLRDGGRGRHRGEQRQ